MLGDRLYGKAKWGAEEISFANLKDSAFGGEIYLREILPHLFCDVQKELENLLLRWKKVVRKSLNSQFIYKQHRV